MNHTMMVLVLSGQIESTEHTPSTPGNVTWETTMTELWDTPMTELWDTPMDGE